MEFAPLYNNPIAINNHLNFLSSEEIKLLENDISSLPYYEAEVGLNSEKEKSIRRSQVKWIPYSLEKFRWIYQKVIDQIHIDNSNLWRFDINYNKPHFQYTEYNGNQQGHYDWHTDSGPNFASHRKVSITLQLSDSEEYEGGFLQLFNFYNLPQIHLQNIPNNPNYIQSIKKQQGALTIFPSFIPHRVTPVTKGIRKSLVLWVGGVPFR